MSPRNDKTLDRVRGPEKDGEVSFARIGKTRARPRTDMFTDASRAPRARSGCIRLLMHIKVTLLLTRRMLPGGPEEAALARSVRHRGQVSEFAMDYFNLN
jgi:hypothetical protein